jgi:hypothetical protein
LEQDIDPLELTRQLTLVDWLLFKRIHPKETIGLAWNIKEKQHQARNILAVVDRSNTVHANIILYQMLTY